MFERLVSLTRGELGGKFYRDHFSHMIRVHMLSQRLARAMALPEKDIRVLEFASLLHDLTIPLQEAEKIQTSASQSSFSSFKSIDLAGSFFEKYENVEEISQISCRILLRILEMPLSAEKQRLLIHALIKGILTRNHGLMSAIESHLMLDEETRDLFVLFHKSDLSNFDSLSIKLSKRENGLFLKDSKLRIEPLFMRPIAKHELRLVDRKDIVRRSYNWRSEKEVVEP